MRSLTPITLPDDPTDDLHAATKQYVDAGGGAHPDLATHDALGLATDTELGNHTADAADAHAASAVGFDDTGLTITAANAQEMGEALDAAISGGGIPATIFDAAGDIIVGSAADTAARLPAGSEDDVLTIVSGVPAWSAPSGGGGSFVDYAHVRLTTGNKTLTSTTWIDLDTGLDLVVTAATGDLIEASLNGLWADTAQFGFLDLATWVAGAGVNWFGSGELTTSTGNGINNWSHSNDAIFNGMGGPVHYVVQAGDISGGTVTLRLRTRVAASLILRCNTSDPLMITAKVFRP